MKQSVQSVPGGQSYGNCSSTRFPDAGLLGAFQEPTVWEACVFRASVSILVEYVILNVKLYMVRGGEGCIEVSAGIPLGCD